MNIYSDTNTNTRVSPRQKQCTHTHTHVSPFGGTRNQHRSRLRRLPQPLAPFKRAKTIQLKSHPDAGSNSPTHTHTRSRTHTHSHKHICIHIVRTPNTYVIWFNLAGRLLPSRTSLHFAKGTAHTHTHTPEHVFRCDCVCGCDVRSCFNCIVEMVATLESPPPPKLRCAALV